MKIPNLDEHVPPQYHARLIEAIERSLRSFRFFCRYWLGFDPHDKQLEMAAPSRFTVAATGSGVGKSTGASAFLLWDAWRNDLWSLGAFAPTNSQVKLLVDDIGLHILRGENKFAIFLTHKPTKDDPWLGIGDSRVYFLNTAYGAEHARGLEFNGVLMDEAAMDKRATFELVRTRARLAPGWVRLLSTPKGKGSYFFEEAQRCAAEMTRADVEGRRPRYRFITASSYDNPHYDREILAERKATTPERVWRQEYMGEFVDMEGATFRQADLDRVFDARWDAEESPRPDGLYSHGWDLGRKTTYTVGTTLAYDKPDGVDALVRGIEQEDYRGERWTTIFERINEREAKWGENGADSRTILDATGVGDVVGQSVDVIPEEFIFTQKTRGELLLRLTQAVEKPNTLLLPRSWTTLYGSMQLHTAKEDAPGETWDHLDSTGLAYWLAYEKLNFGTGFRIVS